jgi:hypothetical protein
MLLFMPAIFLFLRWNESTQKPVKLDMGRSTYGLDLRDTFPLEGYRCYEAPTPHIAPRCAGTTYVASEVVHDRLRIDMINYRIHVVAGTNHLLR